MTKYPPGIGTFSLVLSVMGIIFAFTLFGVCVGDSILNMLDLRAWSGHGSGIHLTVYYSLIFFIPSFLIGLKNKNYFGAKTGNAGLGKTV